MWSGVRARRQGPQTIEILRRNRWVPEIHSNGFFPLDCLDLEVRLNAVYQDVPP